MKLFNEFSKFASDAYVSLDMLWGGGAKGARGGGGGRRGGQGEGRGRTRRAGEQQKKNDGSKSKFEKSVYMRPVELLVGFVVCSLFFILFHGPGNARGTPKTIQSHPDTCGTDLTSTKIRYSIVLNLCI